METYQHDIQDDATVNRKRYNAATAGLERMVICSIVGQQRAEGGGTLMGFFRESALLSVLEVLAALGDVLPLDLRSSFVGDALPSGLEVCFLRPLLRVDI